MIAITRSPIDPDAMAAAIRSQSDGALVTFLGVVRNHADDRSVDRLEYHAYEPMALSQLERIGREAETRWPVRIAIVHRLGCLEIGEASVGIVVASPHRTEAFEACRYAIEAIKVDVPIWKREHYTAGAAWVAQDSGELSEPSAC
jgi:molybdopterin synthase catalytic subunit